MSDTINPDDLAREWSDFMVEELRREHEVFGNPDTNLSAEFVAAFGDAMANVMLKQLYIDPPSYVWPDGTEDRSWYRTFIGLHPDGLPNWIPGPKADLADKDRDFLIRVTIAERGWFANQFVEAGVVSRERFIEYMGDYLPDYEAAFGPVPVEGS